jgi:hypothetical protein
MKTIEADLDIVKVVRTPEEAKTGVTIPAPQPGEARDLRVHVSTKTGPANFAMVAKRTGERLSNRDGTPISEDYRPSPAITSAGLGSLDTDAEAPLTFSFMLDELDAYVIYRSEGLAKKSQDWVKRASQALWESTGGEISQTSMAALRTFTLDKYSSIDSHRKVLGFATAFLKHLAKTRFEPRYQSFDIFLEPPKTVRVRKAITERIVTREDIVQALGRVDAAEREGNITPSKVRNYRAFTLLASYTGLRPSTIQRLTVGQFRTAMKEDKSVLQHNLEIIDKAAADGKWQAAAWKLERRYPTQYGRQEKRLLEHSGEIKAEAEDVDTRLKKWRQLVEELNADANRSEETAGDSG